MYVHLSLPFLTKGMIATMGPHEFFAKLEKEKTFHIKHGWTLCYPFLGMHPFHTDGEYKGLYRMILTLGAFDKWMWFRPNERTDNDEEMIGVKVYHGETIFMTAEGGGKIGSIEHAALGGQGSWFIGLELDFHPDIEQILAVVSMEDGTDDVEDDEEDEGGSAGDGNSSDDK